MKVDHTPVTRKYKSLSTQSPTGNEGLLQPQVCLLQYQRMSVERDIYLLTGHITVRQGARGQFFQYHQRRQSWGESKTLGQHGELWVKCLFSEVVKRHADPAYTFHVSLPWTPLTPLSK